MPGLGLYAERVESITGIVLAGGRSARMGRDKALLDAGGQPLVVALARRLAELGGEVLVASGDGGRLAGLGLDEVADVVAGAGPLGGIVAGLERASTTLAAVVAVDMPEASPAVLRLLAAAHRGEPAVVPAVAGRLQPLHAVWATAAAGDLRRLLADGQRSVTAAARLLGARVAGPQVWAPADPAGAFARNVNRPRDLRR